MNEALLVSNIVLWVLVVVLALIVLALARQVGVLHQRVAPAGALMPASGPKVGERTEALDVSDLNGRRVRVGGDSADGLATLIMFLSPTCPVCKSLVPAARSLAMREGARMRLVFASDGDSLEQHKTYAADLKLDAYPYVVSQALGISFGVSKLPFAVLLGADGTLQSKGLVNTREHLESLVEAMDSGVTSLQEYVAELEAGHGKSQEERVS